jgi:secondary thiamine-phosphate synthase enzyme
MVYQDSFTVATQGRGTYQITDDVQERVSESGVQSGMCNVFIHHTSASLIFCENADPQVRADLERYLERLVPDGDPLFKHAAEGEDDMSAHVRTVLTASEVTLPVARLRCAFGTWQGLYVWEHRTSGRRRRVTVTVCGE